MLTDRRVFLDNQFYVIFGHGILFVNVIYVDS